MHNVRFVVFVSLIRTTAAVNIQDVYPRTEFEHDTPDSIIINGHLNPRYANTAARDRVFSQWQQYWNMSQPYLLEKSPHHRVATRLLQYYFTPEQTYFVLVLRHPFGIRKSNFHHFSQHKNCHVGIDEGICDCGVLAMREWLHEMAMIFEDLAHLKHIRVLYYEMLTDTTVQGAQSH